jgi:hypothetical protein
MLTDSWEATTSPGLRRRASLLPVEIMSTGLLITLTDPARAVEFWLIGVPVFTLKSISIWVGSLVAGRTAVTWPTLIPPNSTAAPGERPPA